MLKGCAPMGKTIKALAAEIGVSKQAVYKRATGRLASVCTPHIYMEGNTMCIDSEGEAIIKNDFLEKPLQTRSVPMYTNGYAPYPNDGATPYSNTVSPLPYPTPNKEQLQNAYNPNINPIPNTNPYMEQMQNAAINAPNNIQNVYTPNTSPNANPYLNTNQMQNAPNRNQNTYNTNMEQMQSAPYHTQNTYNPNANPYSNMEIQPERIQNEYETSTNPYVLNDADTECLDSHSEQMSNEYGIDTNNINLLRMRLEQSKDRNHEIELELVKANAEKESLEAVIAQLNQRLSDKNAQIEEQRALIEKTDDERKILTASLFKNNEVIGELLQLSLSKRVFQWKAIQKQLMDKQNDIFDADVSPVDEPIEQN